MQYVFRLREDYCYKNFYITRMGPQVLEIVRIIV